MFSDNPLTLNGMFEYFFDNHPDGMCILDLNDRFLRANASALNMLGYTEKELVETSSVQLVPRSGIEPKSVGEHIAVRRELALPHKQGHFIYVRATFLPLVREGTKVGTVMTFEDVTEQKAQRQDLLDIQELFVFISEKSQNIISSFSPEGFFTYISPNVTELLGYSPEEVIGQPMEAFNPKETNGDLLNYRNSSVSDPDTRRFTGRLLHKNGEHRWYETTVQYIRDKSGAIRQVIGVGRDITERKKAEEKIAYLAYHDPLTDLPNRRSFNRAVSDVLGKSTEEHTLMLLDLDNFKSVNDTFGHAVGDLLLIQIAKRLTHIVGESGTVARLGGDEFTIFYLNTGHGDDILNRIKEVISEPIVINDSVISVTSSIGTSHFPADGDSVDTLIRNADIEMYRAKQL